MSAGLWVNNDGMPLQYGTAKAWPSTAGDYSMPGPNRIAEVVIDLSTLITANATVVDLNTIIPSMANFYVEAVELVAEVGMSTGSSPTLSIGLCSANLTGGSSTVNVGTTATTGYASVITTATVPSSGGTAFVNAAAASTLSTAGDRLYLTYGSTAAGGYIGDYEDTTNLTYPTYITATLGTHTATGKIRCRIYYHGVGTISN